MSEAPSQSLTYVNRDEAEGGGEDFTPAERTALAQVNARVAAAPSLDATLDFLFEATKDICACDRLSVAFVEPDEKRVTSQWVRADYEPLVLPAGYSELLHQSSLEQVLASGRPRIISDLAAYAAEHPGSQSSKLLVREGVRSSMTCPLYVDDRIVGLLFRSSRQAGAYDQHQVRLHQAMAQRISQAVEKAWRIERLAAANRAYTEMLGFVAHELKSPVASLVMDAQLLADGYLGPLEDQQREKIRRIIAKGEYLTGLIGEYLDLAHIEAGELKLRAETIDDFIARVVQPALDIIETPLAQKHMRLERDFPEALPGVQADPNLLKIVLVNFLSNAVKYGREQGRIVLTVAPSADNLHVEVFNEGPGFAPEQKGRLFRKFSRLDSPELRKQKGTGVGLYTAARIVRLHQGHIDARSAPGQWARFFFDVPQPGAGEAT